MDAPPTPDVLRVLVVSPRRTAVDVGAVRAALPGDATVETVETVVETVAATTPVADSGDPGDPSPGSVGTDDGADIDEAESDGGTDADGASSFDCVVTGIEPAGGHAADLLNSAANASPDPPVVLIVDAADGTVPAAAVTEPFAEVVALETAADRTAAADRVAAAIESVVPKRVDPRVIGDHPADARSMDAWKATLFDRLLTEVPLHVFVKNERGEHVMVSEAAVASRIHPSGRSYLGKRDVDGIVPDEEALEPYHDDLRVIETGDRILEKVEHYPSTDRWFRTSKVRWEDESRGRRGVIGIALEETARKDRERHLSVVNHVVRHTMRNDLNVVRGWADFLRSEREREDRADGCDVTQHGDVDVAIDRILEAADRLVSKVDKQQTIVDVMVHDPVPAPLDVARIVRAETRGFERDHPAASVRLDADGEAVAHAIDGFEHVVIELLENAAVHAAGDPTVNVAVETGGGEVRIAIEDDCPPIPDHEVDVLTGRTEIDQLNHSSGLGLWASNWVVKRSGGRIEFDRLATSRGDGDADTNATAADAPGGNRITVVLPVPE